MNELREKIADLIVKDTQILVGSRTSPPAYDLTDEILALVDAQPSGLIAEKECPCTRVTDEIKVTPIPRCLGCGGSGTITRELSVKEALEVINDYVEHCNDKGSGFTLPSGERVKQKS